MPFSPTIKYYALVAAARHCCVCHRYKGLKIEVHHIDQEAEGGANSIENAIALCHDCHTDAGHYNDNHPRGTKFSKPELRKARDEWYKIVQEHKIQAPSNTSNHLHFRHMVLQDYETASEIFSGDLVEFPFPNTSLLRNDILKFITPFCLGNEHKFHVNSIEFGGFNTDKEIFEKYPDAELTDKSGMEFPYFHVTRTPKREELLSILTKLDPFVVHLLKSNIDPVHFAKSVIYENHEGCGEANIGTPHYIENIIFKQFWYSFLAITNTSAVKVELLSLTGNEQNNTSLLVNVLSKENETKLELQFPKVALLPNETIIVPCAVILVPFEEESFNQTIISDNEMSVFPRSQVLTHLIRNAEKTEFAFLGKYIRPSGIVYNADDRVNISEMHELDLNNLLVLNRWWHMGSCPHLFYQKTNAKLEYVKELLTRTPGVEMLEQIKIPDDVNKIVIAELEEETTYLNSVMINDKIIYSNIILVKGQTLEFDVRQNDAILIKGYYVSEKENVRKDDKIILRNQIVRQFLRQNIK